MAVYQQRWSVLAFFLALNFAPVPGRNSAAHLRNPFSILQVDWSSGSALSTLSSPSGVSTDMHVTFLSRAMVGETVTIEGTIDKLGKRLAFTRVEIRNKSKGGEVVVVAVHTKFVGGV